MFEGLKKKFSNFIGSFSKREEEKAENEAAAAETNERQAAAVEEQKPREAAAGGNEEPEAVKGEPAPRPAHRQAEKEPENKEQRREVAQQARIPVAKPPARAKAPEPVHAPERPGPKEVPIREERREEKKPGISVATKIKGLFLGNVKVSEKDVEPFVESLKMDLIQSDVNYDVAERIVDSIRDNLVGKSFSSRDISGQVSSIIKDSIKGILNKGSGVDIVRAVQAKRLTGGMPYRILFIGPNGAGKTTTMAKIARLMLNNNITCVMSASDTFRAAAVEQTVHHAEKLGISVIKGKYGADPASVAFDAIAHARAHGIDVVLIDSAGRQETNRSLIEELKKISRIAQPDMKIFIGESIAGNALLSQVKTIDEAIKIDGVILTKLDLDAKGGNTLSILGDTPIPILFFGMGEKYTDLIPYEPDFIVNNIFGNN